MVKIEIKGLSIIIGSIIIVCTLVVTVVVFNKPLSVCEVEQNAAKYSRKELIKVKGYPTTCVDLSILSDFMSLDIFKDKSIYMLDDCNEDCYIFIVTSYIPPPKGETTVVKGKLKQLYNIFGLSRVLYVTVE